MDWLASLNEIELLWPWVVAFLPLPWLVRRLIKPTAQKQTPLLAPHIVSRIEQQLPQERLIEPNQRNKSMPLLFILLWLLLLLAASRPISFLAPTPFKMSGKELMLAVDLSGSMQKEDMYLGGQDVNRLVAVKAVVSAFIEQRKGDRIGLVVFGTQAFIQSPLTYDLQTVQTLLNETAIGMAGNSTAIGDAIGLTLKHLQQSEQQKAVLILLTDGSNTAGQVDPLKAAEKAKQLGLKIYTVAVGRVEHRTGLDMFLQGGNDIDTASLKRIAQMTEGRFFQANDTKQLSEIYQYINQLESVDHEVFNYRHRSELYYWPLGLAFILSLLMAVLQLKRHGG